MTADGNGIFVDRAFRNRVNDKVRLEFLFFQRKGIILRVQKFALGKGMEHKRVVILQHFGYKQFDLLRQLKFSTGIFGELESDAEVRFNLRFHSRCTRRGGFSPFMVLWLLNRTETLAIGG